jgi:nucleotide-binding universal stress UspA family protein
MSQLECILVPTDFSDLSDSGFEVAAQLAERFDLGITLVHAYRAPSPPFEPARQWSIEDREEAAQEWMDEAVSEARLRYPRCEGVVVCGDPCTVILTTARERAACMIVIGSHCRRGLSRWVLGSVARQVGRTSPVPVVIVPAAAYSAVLSRFGACSDREHVLEYDLGALPDRRAALRQSRP